MRCDFLWMLVFAAHLVFAAVAWWILPHGFPWSHVRFWSNEAAPLIVFALCTFGLAGLYLRRVRPVRIVMTGTAAAYFAMSASWLVCFPVSGKNPAAATILCGLFLSLLCWRSLRGLPHDSTAPMSAVLAGLLLGAFLPWWQRGADSATHPSDAELSLAAAIDLETGPVRVQTPEFASVSPETGAISVRYGDVAIGISPWIEFISRSPDRCWTILARDLPQAARTRRLIGWKQTDGAVRLYFNESSLLDVNTTSTNSLYVDAVTSLDHEVYSHLNTFCRLDVRGHKQLFVSFSPCPEARIEVTFADYPDGSPARFAYLDAAGVFRVVEATSGEKGPFVELAKGPLERQDDLSITLHDAATPIGRIRLEDFAAQASTQLSPTAGWGVSENAIEFSLHDDRPDSGASFWITLAGTSIGRGWDSVGHAPGVYHNRMEFVPMQVDDEVIEP
ncbi:hypothetical protein OAS39_08200 [Pirellulales bacterium]|nr:hypothetical protein [Pirellulales bacterium]